MGGRLLLARAIDMRIDAALVERYVMTLASFGAHGETGVWRTVYSPEWVAATDQYADWCKESGLAFGAKPWAMSGV